jgi:hypothetical protein
MVRLMADPAFRQEQHSLLHEPHIAPISAYIDTLGADGRWMPYVAPLHGGVEARLLSVARDPGPKTQDATGSGMLCVENDDQTAANQFDLLNAAGLRASDYNPGTPTPGTSMRLQIESRYEKEPMPSLVSSISCPHSR